MIVMILTAVQSDVPEPVVNEPGEGMQKYKISPVLQNVLVLVDDVSRIARTVKVVPAVFIAVGLGTIEIEENEVAEHVDEQTQFAEHYPVGHNDTHQSLEKYG